MDKKILIVEDNIIDQTIIKEHLKNMGIIYTTHDVVGAVPFIESTKFDIILLDLNLPTGSGHDICLAIRNSEKNAKTPIIFLTSDQNMSNLVTAFSLGANDYIKKPFSVMELQSRVSSYLKASDIHDDSSVYVFHNLEINSINQQAFLLEGDDRQLLDLTATEFRLLHLLSKHPNQVFSREVILKNLWGDKLHVNDRVIDTHLSKLRKKLGKGGRMIQSIHKAGYKIALPEDLSKAS